jgi:hypothetical protein
MLRCAHRSVEAPRRHERGGSDRVLESSRTLCSSSATASSRPLNRLTSTISSRGSNGGPAPKWGIPEVVGGHGGLEAGVVRASRIGKPLVSTTAWILLVNPPRDRPMVCIYSD